MILSPRKEAVTEGLHPPSPLFAVKHLILRVLMLASCSQLDSSVVKYYARIMKSSGIRAIAGYHDIAPGLGDDVIATNFINHASAGNSVWYSWQHANNGYNWAVLVYQENANQYYRLPGFP